MTFKDAAIDDIDAVFLETDEFAERITLDGRAMLAVVERDDVEFRDPADDRVNVVYDAATLYVCKTALDAGKYLPGLRVNFNGQVWFVFSCDGEDMVTLKLYKERS